MEPQQITPQDPQGGVPIQPQQPVIQQSPQPQQQYPPSTPNQPEKNSNTIVALILSIIGLFFPFFSIVGIILGVKARARAKLSGSGQGMATTVIVVGIITLLISSIAGLILIGVFNSTKSPTGSTSAEQSWATTNENTAFTTPSNDDITFVKDAAAKAPNSTILQDCETLQADYTAASATPPIPAPKAESALKAYLSTINQGSEDCITATNNNDTTLFAKAYNELAVQADANTKALNAALKSGQ